MRAAVAIALTVALCSVAAADAVQTIPPLDGHVSDPGNQIAATDRARLDTRLEDIRLKTGFAIVAYVVTSLQGETIEDLSYRAFNQWKVGDAGKDNGILIAIATGDRKVRIETGKGAGGAVTDLQASDIIANQMAPQLKQGHIADAIDAATTVLVADVTHDASAAPAPAAQASDGPSSLMWIFVALVGGFVLLLVVSPRFRAAMSRGGGGGGWGGGGGGWGGGGGGWGGGGGGGGSGYSGGGGSSGGGGASGSY